MTTKPAQTEKKDKCYHENKGKKNKSHQMSTYANEE
jgi:hypothetical protein